MIINDPIYGEVKITEPVLIDLIKSKALQRLKHINQHGANYFYWPEAKTINRHNHSVGVMLLIRKLKGSLKEQIAGLLHDVAHSAFSHVLDYLVDNREHQAHEQMAKKFIETTDIPEILKNYDYDLNEILDHASFGLLEQPAPALCADRVDYFLRDSLAYGMINKPEIEKILRHLAVKNNMIVTTSAEVAKLMGERYLEMDREYWATSKPAMAVNYALVEIIRHAFGIGVLRFEDLWTLNDQQVVDRLKGLQDPIIDRWFALMQPDILIIEDPDRYDVHVYTKIRLIDPPVLIKNKLSPLSQLDHDFADQLAQARDFPQELFLRFHQ